MGILLLSRIVSHIPGRGPSGREGSAEFNCLRHGVGCICSFPTKCWGGFRATKGRSAPSVSSDKPIYAETDCWKRDATSVRTARDRACPSRLAAHLAVF